MQEFSRHIRYDTHEVGEPERFSYWREAVCDTYVLLGCEYDGEGPFDGSIDVRRHSHISFSNIGGTRHQAFRRRYDISRSNENDFLLSLQMKQTASVDQRGNNAQLQPCDFVIYDSTEPYTLGLTDGFEMMVLQFPKEKLLARLPDAEMLTGVRVNGQDALGEFVSGNLTRLANLIEEQEEYSGALLQESILDLIASALAGIRGSRYELSMPEQHILLRAKSYIRSNLDSADLCRESVAACAGLSVRRLSEIFASANLTISGYIRNQRLQRVGDDLRDPRFANQTISEIALRNGFGNFQYFSSLFRRSYGCTPSQYRLSNSN